MLIWLFIIILSYLFFSLSSFGDKLVLSSRANPKLYTFYVGFLSILVVFLIPFIKFDFPSFTALIWIILEAIVYLLALYSMFLALEKFDVSRVIPTIGAIQPMLILVLTWIFWGPQIMRKMDFLAFIMLFLGSIIISMEKTQKITVDFLKLSMFSSLMFSLDYVFSKFIFLNQPFLQGIIWMRIFSFLFVLIFLFSKEFRKEVFTKQTILDKKRGFVFLFAQLSGGIAYFLQSFAISLVPIAYLAVINSLRGVQYIFLFIITLFFSFLFPKILKEKVSKKIIIQKTISILLIVSGLAILIF